jgi:uncharacterized protein YukE
MSGRNEQELLSTWVPAELAAAFRSQARGTEGGTSAALRRLIAEATLEGLHGAKSVNTRLAPAGAGKGDQIGIRLKGVERRVLDEAAKARGTSPANWIRSLAIVHLARKPQWNGAGEEALRELGRELARIGNNVNQIARAINAAEHTGDYPPHQGVAVREAAELIRYEMRRVVAVLSGEFDYWGLPDAERPTAASGAADRYDAEAMAAEARRKRRPRRRPARFVEGEQ